MHTSQPYPEIGLLLQTIDIINPANLSIVATITKDQSGAPLTNAGSDGNPVNQSRTWNDGVFLEAIDTLAPQIQIRATINLWTTLCYA